MVLAAGAGSRFTGGAGGHAGHKLLAPFRGRPLVVWAVEAAIESGVGETWVVTGAVPLAGVLPQGVRVLENPRWREGQATSLHVATAAAVSEGLEAVVVGLGDQPMVAPRAWSAVAETDAPIAVATYHGKRRNPVRLSQSVWELMPVSGDEGARSVMRERPDLVREVPCEGEPADIDTREDLTKWS